MTEPRSPVPGLDPDIVEYDENGNVVLTGTDIPATDEDIAEAEGEYKSGA